MYTWIYALQYLYYSSKGTSTVSKHTRRDFNNKTLQGASIYR
jgi:hypothetical protein